MIPPPTPLSWCAADTGFIPACYNPVDKRVYKAIMVFADGLTKYLYVHPCSFGNAPTPLMHMTQCRLNWRTRRFLKPTCSSVRMAWSCSRSLIFVRIRISCFCAVKGRMFWRLSFQLTAPRRSISRSTAPSASGRNIPNEALVCCLTTAMPAMILLVLKQRIVSTSMLHSARSNPSGPGPTVSSSSMHTALCTSARSWRVVGA